MSERVMGFAIALKDNVTEGQAEALKSAFKLFSEVLEVTPVTFLGIDAIKQRIEKNRVQAEVRDALLKGLTDAGLL